MHILQAGSQDLYTPSEALWYKAACNQRHRGELLGLGTLWEEDFTQLLTGSYVATQATAGTFALDPDAPNGVALADCASATAAQGINVQFGTAGCFVPAANRNIYFEARVKAEDIATGPEFFLGLSVIDTTILASSALSANSIGFLSVTDNNVILASSKNADGAATASSIHTFVDTEWVKLGFLLSGVSSARFFVNGVQKGIITTKIPAGLSLIPSLVCQSGGTTDPIIHIDWGRAWADR